MPVTFERPGGAKLRFVAGKQAGATGTVVA
jgi:hypothetical protein